MTNKFQIPNRDFVIWVLEFCRSTLPHYTHKLIGSGCKPEPAGILVDNDASRWYTGIPKYEFVACKNIYDGIDMKFYGNNLRMEYDIIVHPGASPSRVQLLYSGIEGMWLSEGAAWK